MRTHSRFAASLWRERGERIGATRLVEGAESESAGSESAEDVGRMASGYLQKCVKVNSFAMARCIELLAKEGREHRATRAGG
jgi:hypothetical protein